MSDKEVYAAREELERQLSAANAKIADASDLAQKINVLTKRCEVILAGLQGDVEEIYLKLGDEENGGKKEPADA